MRARRIVAALTCAALLAACGGGETAERTRNVALTVKSVNLPFAATNVSPYDLRWSQEAQRAVLFSGDAAFEGLWTGSSVVLKTSDPLDESVPSSFPVGDGTVNSVAPDGQGGWYVGGRMSSYAGSGKNRLVHVKADGTVDNAFGLDYRTRRAEDAWFAAVTWVANHPNGTDLLVAVTYMSKIDGVDIDATCPRLVVLDRTTGRRKADLEPDSGLYGCARTPVLIGNRVVMASNGNGDGVPALISIDLTTKQKDTFADAANAAMPYFRTSEFDERTVSEVVVRGGVVWVFGKLDATARRILKFDASTGAVLAFPAPSMPFAVGNESMVQYAVNARHVMVHAGELGPEGQNIDTFRTFDAATGAPVAWKGAIKGWDGGWAVNDVAAWGDGFILGGPIRRADGKPVRSIVAVGPDGTVAKRQPPFVIADGTPGSISVFEFPEIDRTFVTMDALNLLYGAYPTGPVLVTDKDGAPVEMVFGDELTDRYVSSIGVVGKWLYVASDDEGAGNDKAWVDRYDLVTGARDATWRLETPGYYVWDIQGDAEHLSLSRYMPATNETSIALHDVATRSRTAVVSKWADGRDLGIGGAVVADGHLYVKGQGRGEGDVPPVLKVNLATGAMLEAEIIGGQESAAVPTVHDGKVYAPWGGAIHVFDAATLRHVGEVAVRYASSVAFTNDRMVVTGGNTVEVNPVTLQVIGEWGPSQVSLASVIGTPDGLVSALWSPSSISESVVASGVIALKSDGSLVTKTNHARLRPPAPAAEGLADIGPGSRPVPVDSALPGAPLSVPDAVVNGTSGQRGVDRVAIVSVTAGDRAATVRFRPSGGTGGHTVRTVDGAKSCTTSADACTVKGLTAGVAYRFVVVPDADATRASEPSGEVRPWIAMKKGSSKKATALLKVPGKGKVSWKTKGKACALKGTVVTARAKGTCSLTVSVATKSGTTRSILFVKVA